MHDTHSIFTLQVPSYILMGIPHGPTNSVQILSLSPLGEACTRLDLTAIHEILEKVGYKDDEGIANDVRKFFSLVFTFYMQFFCLFFAFMFSFL